MLRTIIICCFAWALATTASAAETLPSEAPPVKPRLLAQGQAKPKAKPDQAKPNPTKPDAAKLEGKVPPAPLDPATEADVLAFVREHHAELATLLENLKESRPREYQKAVRDLMRVRDRLTQFKKQNAPRYNLELEMWKAESRTQLLAARLQMSDSPELREQLAASLNDQYDRKLAILKFERDMFQDKLDKANQQLQKLDADRSQMVEKQLQTLIKPPATKPVGKPAKVEKKPAEVVKDKPAKAAPANTPKP